MTRSRGPAPGPAPAGEPPALDTPLSPFDARPAWEVGPGRAFEVPGRRAVVRGDATGIAVLAHPLRVARLRAGGRGPSAATRTPAVAEPPSATVTPLGAERTLAVAGGAVTQRVTVAPDAPIAWIEWTADGGVGLEIGLELDARDPDPVGLAWTVQRRAVWIGPAAAGAEKPSAEAAPPFAALVFSAPPETVAVERRPDDDGGVRVEAGVRVPGTVGLRLAVVAAGPGDDLARLLRVADRTVVAVRARASAVDRVLQEGLRATGDDPGLGPAVDRARIALALGPVEPVGPWTAAGLVARGLERLAAGDHDHARRTLDFLMRRVSDDGRAPAAGVGPHATDTDEPRAGHAVLRLLTRYLAWTGDLGSVRGWWPVALRVVRAAGVRGAVAEGLAVVAEELGDRTAAARLRAAGTDGPAEEADAGAAATGEDGAGEGDAGGGGVLQRLVHQRLDAEPDAPRGRLVLRPRPADGERLEIRGLVVGSAVVDVVRYREGERHRFELRQHRGTAPLQVVLAPEVPGERVAAIRVDGAPAELDATVVETTEAGHDGPRWRVPIQLVLDHPRTLEVEMAAG